MIKSLKVLPVIHRIKKTHQEIIKIVSLAQKEMLPYFDDIAKRKQLSVPVSNSVRELQPCPRLKTISTMAIILSLSIYFCSLSRWKVKKSSKSPMFMFQTGLHQSIEPTSLVIFPRDTVIISFGDPLKFY